MSRKRRTRRRISLRSGPRRMKLSSSWLSKSSRLALRIAGKSSQNSSTETKKRLLPKRKKCRRRSRVTSTISGRRNWSAVSKKSNTRKKLRIS